MWVHKKVVALQSSIIETDFEVWTMKLSQTQKSSSNMLCVYNTDSDVDKIKDKRKKKEKKWLLVHDFYDVFYLEPHHSQRTCPSPILCLSFYFLLWHIQLYTSRFWLLQTTAYTIQLCMVYTYKTSRFLSQTMKMVWVLI